MTSSHLILCAPFFSCLQSFPASRSFPTSHFFASCGQSIGVSALASVLAVYIQDSFPLELTGWISLQFKGLSRVFSNTTVQNYQFFGAWLSNKREKIKIYIKKWFASGQKYDSAPISWKRQSFIVYNPQPIAIKTSQCMQQFCWDLILVGESLVLNYCFHWND